MTFPQSGQHRGFSQVSPVLYPVLVTLIRGLRRDGFNPSPQARAVALHRSEGAKIWCLELVFLVCQCLEVLNIPRPGGEQRCQQQWEGCLCPHTLLPWVPEYGVVRTQSEEASGKELLSGGPLRTRKESGLPRGRMGPPESAQVPPPTWWL